MQDWTYQDYNGATVESFIEMEIEMAMSEHSTLRAIEDFETEVESIMNRFALVKGFTPNATISNSQVYCSFPLDQIRCRLILDIGTSEPVVISGTIQLIVSDEYFPFMSKQIEETNIWAVSQSQVETALQRMYEVASSYSYQDVIRG